MGNNQRVVAFVPTLGRNLAQLERTLDSILRQPRAGLEVVVVDNSPNRCVDDKEGVKVISMGLNLGMVGAFQLIREEFPADYYWSLQDDMELLNDCLTPMKMKMAGNPRLAAIAPLQADLNGTTISKPRAGQIDLSEQGGIKWGLYPTRDFSVESLESDRTFSFVFSSGALFRSEAIEDIGGLDLGLWPLQHVDVDLGFRFSKAGWESAICHEALVWHAKSQSTPKAFGQVLSRLNRERISQDFQVRNSANSDNFGQWEPMVIRMSYLALVLGARLDEVQRELDAAKNTKRVCIRKLARKLWAVVARLTPHKKEP